MVAGWHGDRFAEERVRVVRAGRSATWDAVRRTAGTGSGLTSLAWHFRGIADVAGDLVTRGSRSAPDRGVWRTVEEVPGRRLAMVATSRLPGEATLELTVEEHPEGCRVRQRNEFVPAGVAGRLYWYAQLPAHRLVFSRMLDELVDTAERG